MRRFGEYDVLARLTASGPTAVYVARKRGAGKFARMVCLKTYRLPDTDGDDELAAFVAEAQFAMQLRHESCVRVSDVGTQDGISYIAMEYLVGETLEEVLRRARESKTPVPIEVVAAIATRIADGLHHAHELGHVHRDLCPSNVMLTYEGAVKVLDFGLARIEDHIATRTGEPAGRPAYMAPEQLLGHTIDRRSDVFALGVILHEAFANDQRYAGIPAHQLALRTFEEPPPIGALVPRLPEALRVITDRAVETDPARRFATADALAGALNTFLAQASYRDGTNELSRYLRDVFWDRARNKQRVFAALIEGEDAVDALLEVLEAEPPTPLDFPRTTEPLDLLEAAAPTEVASAPEIGRASAMVTAPEARGSLASGDAVAATTTEPERTSPGPRPSLDAGSTHRGHDAPSLAARGSSPARVSGRSPLDVEPTLREPAAPHDAHRSDRGSRKGQGPNRERASTRLTSPLPTPQLAAVPLAASTAKRRTVFGYSTRIVLSVVFGVLAGLAAGLAISFFLSGRS